MNKPDQTAARPLRCSNRACGLTLGHTGPDFLLMGPAAVYSRVVLTCLACGTKKSWRPDHKRVAPGGGPR